MEKKEIEKYIYAEVQSSNSRDITLFPNAVEFFCQMDGISCLAAYSSVMLLGRPSVDFSKDLVRIHSHIRHRKIKEIFIYSDTTLKEWRQFAKQVIYEMVFAEEKTTLMISFQHGSQLFHNNAFWGDISALLDSGDVRHFWSHAEYEDILFKVRKQLQARQVVYRADLYIDSVFDRILKYKSSAFSGGALEHVSKDHSFKPQRTELLDCFCKRIMSNLMIACCIDQDYFRKHMGNFI